MNNVVTKRVYRATASCAMLDLWFLSISYVVVVLVVLGSMDVVHRYDHHEHGDNGEIGEDRTDGSLGTWRG